MNKISLFSDEVGIGGGLKYFSTEWVEDVRIKVRDYYVSLRSLYFSNTDREEITDIINLYALAVDGRRSNRTASR